MTLSRTKSPPPGMRRRSSSIVTTNRAFLTSNVLIVSSLSILSIWPSFGVRLNPAVVIASLNGFHQTCRRFYTNFHQLSNGHLKIALDNLCKVRYNYSM